MFARWRSGLFGFVAVVSTALFCFWLQRAVLIRYAPRSAVIVHARLTQRIDEWQRHGYAATSLKGVVFGDSVIAPPNQEPAFIPTLSTTLAASGMPNDVLDLSHMGLSAFQFYYLIDRVLPAQPRFALVEVNLRTFAPDWYENESFRMPQLAEGLGLRRAIEVRDALATQQMGPWTPVAFRLQRRTGTLFAIDGLRSRIADRFSSCGVWVNAAIGLPVRTQTEQVARLLPDLPAGAGKSPWYNQDFVSSPTAVMLRALLQALRDAGTVTVVFVGPIQTSALLRHEVDLNNLEKRVDRLRLYLQVPEEDWFETSDLVGRTEFKDVIHPTAPAIERLATFLSEKIARRLRGDGPPVRTTLSESDKRNADHRF